MRLLGQWLTDNAAEEIGDTVFVYLVRLGSGPDVLVCI